MKPQHGHIIITESYFEGNLASTKQEYEVNLFSTKETIFKDLIDSVGVFTSSETNKINIELCRDSQGRIRLIKRWVA